MRDYAFMSQLPTSYLQDLLAHGGLSHEEKSSARIVLVERKQPFKKPQRRKPGNRAPKRHRKAPARQT
jgi:hypothetical protein